jgi:uncharacterized phage protein (TIGR02220 family)
MTGLDAKRYKKALIELQDREYIAIQGACLWLSKAIENDPNISLSNKKHLAGIQNVVNSMPKVQLILDFCEKYGLNKPFDTPSDGLLMAFESPSNHINPNPNPNIVLTPNIIPDINSNINIRVKNVPISTIIEYLNEHSGHHYPTDTAETVKNISARWNEFPKDSPDSTRLETFYNVIRSRVKKWGTDPKMKDYIRPNTLFSKSKFWTYAGQAESILKEGDDPF